MAIKRRLLSEEVYDQLQRLIYEGVFEPGDRLREADLASEFETSQAPVREALHRLEENWIVEHSPHRGTFVRRLLRQDMEDLLRIRAAYDEVVIRRALPRMSSADLEKMEALVQLMDQHVERHDVASLARDDMAFHDVILDATGSSLLRSMSSSVYGAFMLGVTTVARRSWEYMVGLAARHAFIVHAIRLHDVEGAIRANWEHMRHTVQHMQLSDRDA